MNLTQRQFCLPVMPSRNPLCCAALPLADSTAAVYVPLIFYIKTLQPVNQASSLTDCNNYEIIQLVTTAGKDLCLPLSTEP